MTPLAPVLFDMDGTLVDSRPGIVAALNETLVAEGHAARPESDLVPRIGPPLQVTLGTLLGRSPDDVEQVAVAYRARYRRTMLDGTHVYPGVRELLAALAAEGRPLAVATSKAQPLAVELLEHLGLASWFRAVRGPVPPSREDKAATVRRALDALELGDGTGVVLVGDRSHDVEGGHAHGLRVLGVLWGYGGEAELRRAGADAIARDVDVLRTLLHA